MKQRPGRNIVNARCCVWNKQTKSLQEKNLTWSFATSRGRQQPAPTIKMLQGYKTNPVVFMNDRRHQ